MHRPIAPHLSRRRLLGAGGLALAALPWIGAAARAARPRVSVLDFGAKADGKSDDRQAFQRAIDQLHAMGGGTLFVPAADVARGRYYRLALPFFLRSHVTVEGEGPASLLYNDRERTDLFGDSFVVIPGTYHPAFTEQLVFEPLRPVRRGDDRIRLAAPRSTRFPPGTTVALRGPEKTRTYDGFEDLFWHRLNEVVAVDSDGALRLRYALDEALPPTLEIAATDTDAVRYFPRPAPLARHGMFVAKRAAMRNLELRSNHSPMGDSATFECLFEDLVIRGLRGIYGNLFTHTIWRRITLAVEIQALEASQNSHDSTFSDLRIAMPRWGAENFQVVAFNESPARLVLERFTIDAEPFAAYSPVLRMGHNALACEMRHGTIRAPNARGALVAMDVPAQPNDEARWVTRSSGFSDIACSGGTATSNALLCQVEDAARLEDCWFRDLRFDGGYFRAGRIAGTRTAVEDCAWSRADAPLQMMPQAEDCLVADCVVPGGIELLADGLAERNQLRGITRTAPL